MPPIVLMSRKLYGGYFEASVPERFVDVSNFRQVPDHQEIFHDYELDQVLIVDILEYVKDENIVNAAKIHWDEIVFANKAENQKIVGEGTEGMKELYGVTYPTFSLIGTQQISPYKQPVKNVTILFYLIRLKEYGTDILITMNFPKENVLASDPEYQLFQSFLDSFKLNNPEIFGSK